MKPSVRRNLPFAGTTFEGGNIDLWRAGFIGQIRQPAAVRRKLWIVAKRAGCGRNDLEGLAISFERQCPNVLSSRYPACVEDVLAVGRPVTRKQQLIVVQEFFLRAAPVRGFAEKLEPAIAVGSVDNP